MRWFLGIGALVLFYCVLRGVVPSWFGYGWVLAGAPISLGLILALVGAILVFWKAS